jgi:uncharacterized protein
MAMPDAGFMIIAVCTVFVVALSKAGLLGSLGVVGVPLLSLAMPAREAAGLLLPVLLVMDAIAVFAYRREADWSILKLMLPGAAVGTVLGWALWSFISDAMVLLFVGLITLVFIADAVLPIRKVLVRPDPSRPWGVFWGMVSGFTSFVSHTGGPPFQIYALPQKLPPAVYAGTSAFFFAIVNTAKLIPYFFLGQLSVHNLTVSLMLAPVAAAGVLIGIWLVRRIDARLFYRLAYGLVFVLALKLTWDGATALLA